MRTILLTGGIGALGGCGAVARYWVHNAIVRADPRDFPLGTFVVNASGALLLGLLIGVKAGHDLRLLLGAGLLGAFTTFSTWMFETERMTADGAVRGAATNVIVSLGAGFAAVALGIELGGML